MNNVLEIIKLIIPAFIDFIKYINSINDDEFEKISEAWPKPTKTSLTRLRMQIKVRERFMGNKNDDGNIDNA